MNNKKKYGHHEMPIDEIVKSIRGIINTHSKDKDPEHEDILELTEIFPHNQNKINEDKEQEDLISPEIGVEIKEKLKSFATKAVNHQEEIKKYSSDTTAEELLIKLLNPELKLWLDKNLPQIIDTILTREFRRLINQNK